MASKSLKKGCRHLMKMVDRQLSDNSKILTKLYKPTFRNEVRSPNSVSNNMQIVDNLVTYNTGIYGSDKNIGMTGNTANSYSTAISRIGKQGQFPVGSSGSRYPGYFNN